MGLPIWSSEVPSVAGRSTEKFLFSPLEKPYHYGNAQGRAAIERGAIGLTLGLTGALVESGGTR
jgi:hypothetical protein